MLTFIVTNANSFSPFSHIVEDSYADIGLLNEI